MFTEQAVLDKVPIHGVGGVYAPVYAPGRWRLFTEKQSRMEAEKTRLAACRIRADSPAARDAGELSGHAVSASLTLEELLRRPHVHYSILERHSLDGSRELGLAEREAVEIDIKYAGFIARQVRIRRR